MTFPTDYDGVLNALAPFHRAERPLDYFFAMYVCAVLKRLPDATLAALDDFSTRNPSFFLSHRGDWRKHVVGQLHLSDTIEVAIWDLWLRNRAVYHDLGDPNDVWEFAQDFIEQWAKDDSRVDVWTPENLAAARRRIAASGEAR